MSSPFPGMDPWLESPYIWPDFHNEPINHLFVEVRDPSQGHELVALIEIVSPTNKLPGADRDAYLRKQAEVVGSDANLMEIDLLRGGKRLFSAQELVTTLAQILIDAP